ncbi:hypothetical protein LguiB_009433 [Lonicera macranthoides]
MEEFAEEYKEMLTICLQSGSVDPGQIGRDDNWIKFYDRLKLDFASGTQLVTVSYVTTAVGKFENVHLGAKTSLNHPQRPYEPNQLKEEEKRAISKPPLENKPRTDEIEKIEVTAEKGELWVAGVVPSLQEEEDEEALVEIKEPQVQALPAIGVDENYIKESRSIPDKGRVDKQETSTTVTLVPLPHKQAHEDQMKLQKESMLQVDEVEHVDFIGVDKYDFHPNHQPGSFLSRPDFWTSSTH